MGEDIGHRTSDPNPVVNREYKITRKYGKDHRMGQEASTQYLLQMIDAGAAEYYSK